MDFSHPVSKVPLKIDAAGVVRVGETRVTLDTVIGAFKNGATSEEIVFQFPVLELSDVYAIIGFYLKNQAGVERYLTQQKAGAESIRQKIEAKFPPAGIRQRLLQRRSAHQSPAS
ncbi:MAG: DUF433 domain-containing protein [Haliscomenobacteraceae bacterium CHB4]|nr:hypothetical protein [Saprospiraceae bacterium]MCE7921712.1 DUF433 domain-containing protein [Haliscomenobacteraceae bacterium CHB4]